MTIAPDKPLARRAAIQSEASQHADFSAIRYAQCWEDADVLLGALNIREGDICLSIASGGDNTLSMLARQPGRVVAVDLNPSQLACLELRVAAYRELDHTALLELVGSRPSRRREALYRRCRRQLSADVQAFWDAQPHQIAAGIGGAGKFERYLATFRDRVLPLVHSRRAVECLLHSATATERELYYREHWDTWRWRLVFRLFFSRFVMGRMGRDPSFFRHVQGGVAGRVLTRTRHALTALDPTENPYLQWILTGGHPTALPFALRPENFEAIRDHLDRLEWRCTTLEALIPTITSGTFAAFNLSDVFEYVSTASYHELLEQLVRAGRCGARLVYWNTFAERRRPEFMSDRLRSLDDLGRQLHDRDKAFFYSALRVEEIV